MAGLQVVLSGARVAVEKAVEIAKEMGAKRAMLLPVSAPFHCAMMKPAAEAMAMARPIPRAIRATSSIACPTRFYHAFTSPWASFPARMRPVA